MSTTITPNDLSNGLVSAFSDANFDSVKELRDEAIHHFKNLGLPGKKSEEYRFTPITRMASFGSSIAI